MTACDIHIDAAALCKLDRVPHQIDQYLPQPYGVANQNWRNVGRDPPFEREGFLPGSKSHQFQSFIQVLLNRELHRVQVHLSGFDFGEIENIVQKRQ